MISLWLGRTGESVPFAYFLLIISNEGNVHGLCLQRMGLIASAAAKVQFVDCEESESSKWPILPDLVAQLNNAFPSTSGLNPGGVPFLFEEVRSVIDACDVLQQYRYTRQ